MVGDGGIPQSMGAALRDGWRRTPGLFAVPVESKATVAQVGHAIERDPKADAIIIDLFHTPDISF